MHPGPGRALRAGTCYVGIVFVAGFALGALRMLVLAPRFGATVAVLVEAPVMLGFAWVICGAVLRRFDVPPAPRDRLIMGATAFALLIGLELLLAVALGDGPRAWLDGLGAAPGAIGLAAQVAFALLPALRLWVRG